MTDTEHSSMDDLGADLINDEDFDDHRRPLERALKFGAWAAIVITIISLAVWGGLRDLPGIWGVLLGGAIGGGFVLATALSVFATARTDVMITGVVVLGSWLLKIVVLLVIFSVLKDMTFYDRPAFGVTVIAVTLVTIVVEAYGVITSRVTYVNT